MCWTPSVLSWSLLEPRRKICFSCGWLEWSSSSHCFLSSLWHSACHKKPATPDDWRLPLPQPLGNVSDQLVFVICNVCKQNAWNLRNTSAHSNWSTSGMTEIASVRAEMMNVCLSENIWWSLYICTKMYVWIQESVNLTHLKYGNLRFLCRV